MRETEGDLVFVLCGDAGGANAVAPVIETLRIENRVKVKALAYRQAKTVWIKRGIDFEIIVETTSKKEAVDLIRDCGAVFLLTGTSCNPFNLEKIFIAAAREIKIPSIAVLDFWTNYRERFSNEDDEPVYLPDRIAVMDERARDEMIKAGFQSSRIVVTGQPAFDGILKKREQFTADKWKRIRNGLGIGPEEIFILFVSQPTSIEDGADHTALKYLTYTKQQVLGSLYSNLCRIANRRGYKIALGIRPHPREKPDSFGSLKQGIVRIFLAEGGDSSDMVMSADIITGMSSILLVEACYLGCLVVSLQPGMESADILPTNLSGESIAIYQVAAIEEVLEQLLENLDFARLKTHAQATSKFNLGATGRVVKVVYKMMGVEDHR